MSDTAVTADPQTQAEPATEASGTQAIAVLIVLLLLIGAIAGAYALLRSGTGDYLTTATVMLTVNGQSNTEATAAAQTDLTLIKSNRLLKFLPDNGHLSSLKEQMQPLAGGVTPEVLENLEVSCETGSPFITFSLRGPDPHELREELTEVIQAYSTMVKARTSRRQDAEQAQISQRLNDIARDLETAEITRKEKSQELAAMAANPEKLSQLNAEVGGLEIKLSGLASRHKTLERELANAPEGSKKAILMQTLSVTDIADVDATMNALRVEVATVAAQVDALTSMRDREHDRTKPAEPLRLSLRYLHEQVTRLSTQHAAERDRLKALSFAHKNEGAEVSVIKEPTLPSRE